jgi:DNA-binding sugar fermentation-stimulating protein
VPDAIALRFRRHLPIKHAQKNKTGATMHFNVCYKGIKRFSGNLELAMRFVAEQWGSAGQAYEIGVRLQPVPAGR